MTDLACYDKANDSHKCEDWEVINMQVNTNLFRAKIKERGTTQENLAKALNMNKSTFSRKMKSEALAFSIGEMHRIAEILSLSKGEAEDIFLSENSH